MSYVYLLKHATLPLLKIGLAKEPLTRCKQIGYKAFDLTSSCAIKTASDASAKRLERVLHLLNDSDRQQDSRLPFSGRTEWFSGAIKDKVMAFIHREGHAFGVADIETIERKTAIRNLPRSGTSGARGAVYSGAAWYEVREKTRQRRRQGIERAEWLLWWCLDSAAKRIAEAAPWAAHVTDDGNLFLYATEMDVPNLFADVYGISKMHDIFEVRVDERKDRLSHQDRIYQNRFWHGGIPDRICYSSPGQGGWIYLLQEDGVYYRDDVTALWVGSIRDAASAWEPQRLYWKALARHIPVVMEAIGGILELDEVVIPSRVAPTECVEMVTGFLPDQLDAATHAQLNFKGVP